MKWRTDKPTAKLIVAYLKWSSNPLPDVLCKVNKDIYFDRHGEEIPDSDIVKWADLEEDETVTDCKELEEEINCAIDDLEGVAEKDADGVLIAHLTPIEHLKGFARHFYELGVKARKEK